MLLLLQKTKDETIESIDIRVFSLIADLDLLKTHTQHG